VRVNLDVAITYSEKGIEVSTRARLIEPGKIPESGVALATSLRNRGYAYLVKGTPALTLPDFEQAAKVYARLVGEQGQKDLVPQYIKSLSPLAWLYATSADPSLRSGQKAKQYALEACELSEWKNVAPLEALAAACAETGLFADAVNWQEHALELAPAKQKAELQARLEIYRAGQPYRAPIAK
jgi:tetratricopeptide (TPR) repeat protein